MKKKIKYTLGLISLTAIGAISIGSIVSCSNSSNYANSTSNEAVISNKSIPNSSSIKKQTTSSSTPSTNKSTSNSNSTNNSAINNKKSQSEINNVSNNTQQNSTNVSSSNISSSNNTNTNNQTQTTQTSSNSINNNNVNDNQNNNTKSVVNKPSTSSNTTSQTKTNPNNTNSSKSISNTNNNPSNTNNQSKQNSNTNNTTNKSQQNTNPIVKQTQPVSTNSNGSSSSSNANALSEIQNNYELYVEHAILNWINSNENVNNSQNSSFNDLVKQNMAGYEILNNFQSFSNFKVSFTKLPSSDASSLGDLVNDEWLTITATANQQINFTSWNGSLNNGNGGWGTNVVKSVPKGTIFTWTLPYALNTLTCINSELSLTLNSTYSNAPSNENLPVPFGLSIGNSSDLTSISKNWQYNYNGVIATNFGTNGEDYTLPSTWNMAFNENAAVINSLNYEINNNVSNFANTNESASTFLTNLISEWMAGFKLNNITASDFNNWHVAWDLNSINGYDVLEITSYSNINITPQYWNQQLNNGKGAGESMDYTIPAGSYFTWTLPYNLKSLSINNQNISLSQISYNDYFNSNAGKANWNTPLGLSIGSSMQESTSVSSNKYFTTLYSGDSSSNGVIGIGYEGNNTSPSLIINTIFNWSNILKSYLQNPYNALKQNPFITNNFQTQTINPSYDSAIINKLDSILQMSISIEQYKNFTVSDALSTNLNKTLLIDNIKNALLLELNKYDVTFIINGINYSNENIVNNIDVILPSSNLTTYNSNGQIDVILQFNEVTLKNSQGNTKFIVNGFKQAPSPTNSSKNSNSNNTNQSSSSSKTQKNQVTKTPTPLKPVIPTINETLNNINVNNLLSQDKIDSLNSYISNYQTSTFKQYLINDLISTNNLTITNISYGMNNISSFDIRNNTNDIVNLMFNGNSILTLQPNQTQKLTKSIALVNWNTFANDTVSLNLTILWHENNTGAVDYFNTMYIYNWGLAYSLAPVYGFLSTSINSKSAFNNFNFDAYGIYNNYEISQSSWTAYCDSRYPHQTIELAWMADILSLNSNAVSAYSVDIANSSTLNINSVTYNGVDYAVNYMLSVGGRFYLK